LAGLGGFSFAESNLPMTPRVPDSPNAKARFEERVAYVGLKGERVRSAHVAKVAEGELFFARTLEPEINKTSHGLGLLCLGEIEAKDVEALRCLTALASYKAGHYAVLTRFGDHDVNGFGMLFEMALG